MSWLWWLYFNTVPSRMAYVFWAPSLKHTTPTNGVHSLQLTCHGLKPIINWGLPESREQEPPECTTIQKPNQWKLTQSQLQIPEMAYTHIGMIPIHRAYKIFFLKKKGNHNADILVKNAPPRMWCYCSNSKKRWKPTKWTLLDVLLLNYMNRFRQLIKQSSVQGGIWFR